MQERKIYRDYVKRILDFLLALVGITIGIPFILIAAIFIKLDTPGPVFFTQERVGYKGKLFKIYKLRTMDTRAVDKHGKKIRDRNRVTKSGKIIRKLNIDELPQFWNIIKGEMSFIGPRPLLPRYYPYFNAEEDRRHDVLPGITGLAQVNGRGFLQWEERFAYDLEYVDNLSFKLELQIIWQTIKSVLKNEGTSTVRPEGLVDFDVHRQRQWDEEAGHE